MKRSVILTLSVLLLTGVVLATVPLVMRATSTKFDRRIVLVARDMAFFLVEGQDAAGTNPRGPNPRLVFVPGERVLIEFLNEDAGMQHDLVFEGFATRTRILKQGESDRVVLHVPDDEADSQYSCSLHPKTMRGQVAIGRVPSISRRQLVSKNRLEDR